jgi:hypothetical protein
MSKLVTIAAATLLTAGSAAAQVSSIETNNPASKGLGNPDRIVCEVDETTGTRLGAHKVCKTVLEWQEQRTAHREGVEALQRQGTSVGCQEGQGCGGN